MEPYTPGFDVWSLVQVDSGADGLRARQIKEDIKGLRDATEDVKRYADLVVAHNARETPAPVAFSVISSATDEIVRIAKRYTATLTGASMLSFAPVDQFNWYDVFHFPWIGVPRRPRAIDGRLACCGVIAPLPPERSSVA